MSGFGRQGGFPEQHPVRPQQPQRQRRQRCGRAPVGVADQTDDMGGLAGPVDVAVTVQKRIQPLRRLAPGDAAIRQVKRRGFQRQIAELVIRAVGGDQLRRVAARRPHKSGGKPGAASGIGDGFRQNFIVAGHELQPDPRQRLAGRI